MTAAALRDRLAAAGITLSLDGEQLRYRAPKGAMTPAFRDAIAAERSGLLALLREDSRRIARTLSPMQRAMWLHWRSNPHGSAYNTGIAGTLQGSLDAEALRAAVAALIARYPVLASCYPDVDGAPERRVATGSGLDATEEDATGDDAGSLQARAVAALQAPYDLAHGPLVRLRIFRCAPQQHLVVLGLHHIVTDGLSLHLLLPALPALYTAARDGADGPLPQPGASFDDFVAWQGTLLAGPQGAALEAFWRDRLKPPPPSLPLPFTPAVAEPPGQVLWHLGTAETEALQALAAVQGASLYTALLAGLMALLSRHSGLEDIAIATPFAARTRPEFAATVGCLVNTLVLRGELSGAAGFSTLLARLAGTVREALDHQDLPFPVLVERLNPPRTGHAPFTGVSLALQTGAAAAMLPFFFPADGATQSFADLTLQPLPLPQQLGQFPLAIEAIESATGLLGHMKYDGQRLGRSGAARLARQLPTLLRAAIAAPDEPIATLGFLPPEERAEVTAWNDTGGAELARRDLVALIASQAARQPDAVAIVQGAHNVTYGALERDANRLAHALQSRGVGPGVYVAVAMDRAPEQVVAMLAILKAGGAFLPVDPHLPAHRILFMLDEARPVAVLTIARDTQRLEEAGIAPLVLDRDWDGLVAGQPETPPGCAAQPDDPAYAIYTSGSTGQPKGAVNARRGLNTRLGWGSRTFGLRPHDRVLQRSPASFDVSVWEFLWPLSEGARLVLLLPGQHGDPAAVAATIRDAGVTVAHFVPSLLRAFLAHPAAAGTRGIVRRIFCSGEALPGDVARDCLSITGAEVWNLYGPTEAGIECSFWRCGPDEPGAIVPIGRPSPGTRLHIVDGFGRPVPVGVPAELWIAGAQVGLGYLACPELTAERFRSVPAVESDGLVYATGDIARWREDGAIDFLGRADQQVKLRGFRIELEEIEAQLRAHPAIGNAAAAVQPGRDGGHLVAYIEQRPGTALQGDLNAVLRTHLAVTLPDYMLPTRIVVLDALPISANGKLDRARLPAITEPEPAPAPAVMPAAGLEAELAVIWQELLGTAPGRDDNFFDLGGHSLLLARMQAGIARRLGRDVSLTDLLAHPSITRLARFLGGDAPPAAVAARPAGDEPIAITGFALRFPGAADPETFWRNLRDGVESLTRFDRASLRRAGVPERLLNDPRYVPMRGVLDGIDQFDAGFFGYSPREAETIDPQQRLLLEAAWEALEDAGIAPGDDAPPIGVFAGTSLNTYLLNNVAVAIDVDPTAPDAYQAFIANDKDFAATRIAYRLGLRGPAVTVQNACSTALVAVLQACRSLAAGDCAVALGAAASVYVPHQTGYVYHEGMIASPDGHCRAFDAAARGTTFGNGVAAVVLRPLSAALAAGDRVLAVIRGGAINNDGAAKAGFTAPSVEGQAAAITSALERAGVPAASIGYVETHGTGTPLGDAVEITALNRAYVQAGLTAPASCPIGSVKTNLGHMDVAAGMGGLIKTVLALRHAQVPASLHFTQPHPDLPFAAGPFFVASTLLPWPDRGTPRRAAVSAFGIGGTNVHLILEQGPDAPARTSASSRVAGGMGEGGAPYSGAEPRLLALSAKHPSALAALAAAWASRLGSTDADAAFADLVATAATRRVHHPLRLFAVAASADAMAAGLRQLAAGEAAPASGRGDAAARRSVVFVCPGQGGQWLGMGRTLLAHDAAFRDRLCEVDAAIRAEAGWSLIDHLHDCQDGDRFVALDRIQPALFGMSLGLAAAWEAWGVRPAAVIGHSMGEVAAFCLAGLLSLPDAVRVICRRSALLARIMGRGAMAMVELPPEDAAALTSDAVSVAAVNGPRGTVLSGDKAELEALVASLDARGVFARLIRVDVASHSSQVEPLRDALALALDGVGWQEARLPVVSTVDAAFMESMTPGEQYWWRNLRQPVLFSEGTRLLAGRGHEVFIELGPHPVLTADIAATLAAEGRAAVTLGSTRRDLDERAALLEGVGTVWAQGGEVDWRAVAGSRPAVDSPHYPWQRARYWIEPQPRSRALAAAAHPWLLAPAEAPDRPGMTIWPLDFEATGTAVLAEHVVAGVPTLPGAAFVELALAAGHLLSPDVPPVLAEVALHSALALPCARAQLIAEGGPDAWTLRLMARDGAGWQTHGEARLCRRTSDDPPADLRRRDSIETAGEPGEPIYVAARASGLAFGPAFQGIARLWRAPGRTEARLTLPPGLALPGCAVHPALLDAAFQTLAVQHHGASMPVAIQSVSCSGAGGSLLGGWAVAVSRPGGADGDLVGDVALYDEKGAPAAWVQGLRLRIAALRTMPDLFTVGWRVASPPVPPPKTGRWLVLGAQEGVAGELAARLRAAGAAVRVAAETHLDATGVDNVLLATALSPPPGHDPLEVALAVAQRLASLPAPPRLWIATPAAQRMPDAAGWMAAALWGFARGLVHEHPGLEPSLLDLPTAPSEADLDRAVAQLLAGDAEDQIAISGGQAEVARLQRFNLPRASAPTLRPDAAWLISGGFGVLGLAVARHLAGCGARHLWLAGRSGPGAFAASVITALRDQGVSVRAERCDVADRGAVGGLLAAIDRPLAGIVHAAGVLSDGQVLRLDAAAMHHVLAPKVEGARNLDMATRAWGLEHFVLFSSAVGVLGAPGQANHCAANAALDALAAYRRAIGLPAQSIAWGPWSEIGAAAALAQGAARDGVGVVTPAAGLACLDAVLAAPPGTLPPTIMAVPLDVAEWRRSHAGIGTSRFLSDLAPKPAAAPADDATSPHALRQRIEAAAPRDRIARLRHELVAAVGRVLRVPAAEIDGDVPFGALGLSSLLGLEIRNVLAAGLGLPLPATLVWAHPTLDALTLHLASLLSVSATADSEQGAAPDDIWTLDAAAAAAALDRELAELLDGAGGADG
jgi:amino acid adenylation domain-containing protein